jgi:hypothetical protein
LLPAAPGAGSFHEFATHAAPSHVVFVVGRLISFFGASRLTDKTWCCERCRQAAAGQVTGNRHLFQEDDERQHVEDEHRRPGPEVLERRG